MGTYFNCQFTSPTGCLYLFGLLEEDDKLKSRTRMVYLDKHRQYVFHHFLNLHASASLSTFALVRLWILLDSPKSDSCVFAVYTESVVDGKDPRLSSRPLPPVPTSINVRTLHCENEGRRGEQENVQSSIRHEVSQKAPQRSVGGGVQVGGGRVRKRQGEVKYNQDDLGTNKS